MISWPYAHLLINHFPVVLSVSGLAIAILALVLSHRGLWQTSMGALAVAGVFIFPVHLSGDKADHALKDPWYIKPGTIEAHDAAYLGPLGNSPRRPIRRLFSVEIVQTTCGAAAAMDESRPGSWRCARYQHRCAHGLARRQDHARSARAAARDASAA